MLVITKCPLKLTPFPNLYFWKITFLSADEVHISRIPHPKNSVQPFAKTKRLHFADNFKIIGPQKARRCQRFEFEYEYEYEYECVGAKIKNK